MPPLFVAARFNAEGPSSLPPVVSTPSPVVYYHPIQSNIQENYLCFVQARF